MEKILEAKNLSKIYDMGEVKVKALDEVSFQIYKGEFIVILGASGSGKTTLLNMIGGMDKCTSGEMYYHDQPLHNASEQQLTLYRRDAVGFVFQLYNLIPNLSTLENIQLASDISKKPLDINEVIDNVGLGDRKNYFPSQLSGGQQQRVAIARAIVKNPDILLCDEPTGALDFETGLSVLELLVELNQKYGKTVVIITHNAGIAEIGHRVFKVKDGKINRIIVNETPLSPKEVTW